ncbi:hypothetical protein SDC9_129089 [bioreactor metagenome]|uniref:Uncharacterized protein n=1 Tax=bioreactor metagenome TaxID=1076179 RepID=A0A645CYS4_9ZZZZ
MGFQFIHFHAGGYFRLGREQDVGLRAAQVVDDWRSTLRLGIPYFGFCSRPPVPVFTLFRFWNRRRDRFRPGLRYTRGNRLGVVYAKTGVSNRNGGDGVWVRSVGYVQASGPVVFETIGWKFEHHVLLCGRRNDSSDPGPGFVFTTSQKR